MLRVPRVPAYSHHKPSGQAVIKIADPDSGKRRSVYLGKYGSDESRERYARIAADLLAGRMPSLAPPTDANLARRPGVDIARLVARYQEHAREYYRRPNGQPTSEVASIRCAMRYLLSHHQELPADSFGVGDLRAVRELMIEAGLCRGVVNQNVGRIVRAFRWAASEELVSAEIWSGLRALPGLKAGRTRAHERPSVQPVADELVDATLLELSPTVRAMVELQRSTGMRPAEVCSVRPVDVDRSGDVWVFHPVEHKTQHHGKERSVFIGPRGQDVLRPFLSRAEEEYCFRPTRAASVVKAARRYRVDSYRRAIQRACERAGVERWSPNQLRHSFATRARASYGLEAAQVLLGHSCARITEVYAERDAAKGIAAAKAIG